MPDYKIRNFPSISISSTQVPVESATIAQQNNLDSDNVKLIVRSDISDASNTGTFKAQIDQLQTKQITLAIDDEPSIPSSGDDVTTSKYLGVKTSGELVTLTRPVVQDVHHYNTINVDGAAGVSANGPSILNFEAGTNMELVATESQNGEPDTIRINHTGPGAEASDSYSIIHVGGTQVFDAAAPEQTLNFAQGAGIGITTSTSNGVDTITITNTSTGGGNHSKSYSRINTDNGDVIADGANQTLELKTDGRYLKSVGTEVSGETDKIEIDFNGLELAKTHNDGTNPKTGIKQFEFKGEAGTSVDVTYQQPDGGGDAQGKAIITIQGGSGGTTLGEPVHNTTRNYSGTLPTSGHSDVFQSYTGLKGYLPGPTTQTISDKLGGFKFLQYGQYYIPAYTVAQGEPPEQVNEIGFTQRKITLERHAGRIDIPDDVRGPIIVRDDEFPRDVKYAPVIVAHCKEETYDRWILVTATADHGQGWCVKSPTLPNNFGYTQGGILVPEGGSVDYWVKIATGNIETLPGDTCQFWDMRMQNRDDNENFDICVTPHTSGMVRYWNGSIFVNENEDPWIKQTHDNLLRYRYSSMEYIMCNFYTSSGNFWNSIIRFTFRLCNSYWWY